MMPLNMMRSAPPDFGDHGRTHRGHGTIRDNRPNKRLGGGGGLATGGEYPFLVRPGLDLRRGHPHTPLRCVSLFYVCTAPSLQRPEREVTNK